MAATPSTMVALGSPAPRFSLENPATGAQSSFDDVRGEKGTLVMFICNHCPYVVAIREKLLEIVHDAQARGIGVIAINTNDDERYPQDGPEHMKTLALEENWAFPFVFDRDQSVAHAYQAACTPDFFLFDASANLYYRGQFDDSRPKNEEPVTGVDLQRALDTLIDGQAAPQPQMPSLGCNIKWKPGNEPTF